MITIIAVLLACTASAQNKWITGHAPARNRISESTIMEKVEYLTNDICEGRGTGSRGSVEAAGWIARNFEKIKLLKNNGNYYQRFQTKKGVWGTNVIGFLPGSTKTSRNKYIIVGAHFDHLGQIDSTIYPGADSNASGTAAMMSLAEMFAAMRLCGKTWESNIIFVGFDANGHDLAGSKAFWKMIEQGRLIDPISGARIKKSMITLMANIDQIGCTLSPLRSGREDYIIMLGNHSLDTNRQERLEMCNKLYKLNMEISHSYYGSENFTNMFYRLSDQRVFIDNGIPAVMFTSGITMNNNKTRDKATSLNYPILKKRIYLIYHWLEKML